MQIIKNNVIPALIAIHVLTGFLGGILGCAILFSVRSEKPNDPTFMMECVYGWGQTAENCEAILRGEPPPPLPDDESKENHDRC